MEEGLSISSVVGGVDVCPPVGALFSQALLVLRGNPSAASCLSHEGLAKFEGGLGLELVPPARPSARGAQSVKAAEWK